MRIFAIAVLCSLLAWASPRWTQKGNLWTQNGISVTTPSGLKAAANDAGILIMGHQHLSIFLEEVGPQESFKSYSDQRITNLAKLYKGIKWSEPQNSKDGNLDMFLRLGSLKGKDATMEFTVAMFQKANQKLGVVSSANAANKEDLTRVGEVINSINFR